MAGPEDNIPPLERSPEQLLGLVRAKLDGLDRLGRRRRRTLAVCGAGALSVLLVLAIVAVTQTGRSPSTVVRTAGQGPDVPASPSTTSSDSTSSTVTTSETTIPAVVPNTTLVHPATPTTARRATPNPSATTTTTTAAAPPCATPDYSVTATTDKGSYTIGDPIILTTTLANVSDHDCPLPDNGHAELRSTSAPGTVLQEKDFMIDYFAAGRWHPGATMSQEFTFASVDCTKNCPLAAGNYKFVVSWGVATPAPQTTLTFDVG